MPTGAAFFDQTCFPLLDGWPREWSRLHQAMGKVLWAAPLSPWDKVDAPDFWPRLREGALRLRGESDRG